MPQTATTRGRGRHRGACDFSGTATLATSDPSNSGCAYPASSRFVSDHFLFWGTDGIQHLFYDRLLSARRSSSSASGTSSTPATSTPGTTFTPTNGGTGRIIIIIFFFCFLRSIDQPCSILYFDRAIKFLVECSKDAAIQTSTADGEFVLNIHPSTMKRPKRRSMPTCRRQSWQNCVSFNDDGREQNTGT
ncbi:hypothetical protein MUK42_06283 [Musa troglodytarum]|uniref:Uncharacterized protein n=1 Tax=Musa troglodytarum TaxID=320322 RepID=A0A9E7GSU5_9LILI|nr:hypothetical protein MUK42_06283 [Musa troglodytarum]